MSPGGGCPAPILPSWSGDTGRGRRSRHDTRPGQGACQALEDAVVLGTLMATGAGLATYDRQRRARTQMITRRSRRSRFGAAAQWASPAAVHLRDAALWLLPPSSFVRSLAPVLDWAA
jgi:2-polyprenyl-6-methoxyphenol hydroxylase-like FAD-dependent oxidoreductase